MKRGHEDTITPIVTATIVPNQPFKIKLRFTKDYVPSDIIYTGCECGNAHPLMEVLKESQLKISDLYNQTSSIKAQIELLHRRVFNVENVQTDLVELMKRCLDLMVDIDRKIEPKSGMKLN
jgi:hypothetical protein